MNNKSRTSEQVISLLTGGGALSGVGETIAPDLHASTGNFSVFITLLSNHNGFQLERNRVYSTSTGNVVLPEK